MGLFVGEARGHVVAEKGRKVPRKPGFLGQLPTGSLQGVLPRFYKPRGDLQGSQAHCRTVLAHEEHPSIPHGHNGHRGLVLHDLVTAFQGQAQDAAPVEIGAAHVPMLKPKAPGETPRGHRMGITEGRSGWPGGRCGCRWGYARPWSRRFPGAGSSSWPGRWGPWWRRPAGPSRPGCPQAGCRARCRR